MTRLRQLLRRNDGRNYATLLGKPRTGSNHGEETKGDRVTLEQLMVSILAMTDAMIKLLIRKGIFTDAEFKAELILSARPI